MSTRVDVWEERSGRWRWAWRAGERELLSNQTYPTEQEARAAARVAYPELVPSAAKSSVRPRFPERAGFLSLVLAMLAVWRAYRSARRLFI